VYCQVQERLPFIMTKDRTFVMKDRTRQEIWSLRPITLPVTICALNMWKLVGNHLPNPFVITLVIAMVGNILLVVKQTGVSAMQTMNGMERV
jgi:undecaprenyl pyrophosphate phosphatase UppP